MLIKRSKASSLGDLRASKTIARTHSFANICEHIRAGFIRLKKYEYLELVY